MVVTQGVTRATKGGCMMGGGGADMAITPISGAGSISAAATATATPLHELAEQHHQAEGEG